MAGAAIAQGAAGYLRNLVKTVLFPLMWLQSMRLAKACEETEPKARKLMVAAIVLSLLSAGLGAYSLLWFEDKSVDGFYDQLGGRLELAVGQVEYDEKLTDISAAEATLAILERNREQAEEDGNTTAMAELDARITETEEAIVTGEGERDALEGNHQLWLTVKPLIDAKDDAAIRSTLAGSSAMDAERMSDANEAFDIKASAEDDMRLWMNWLLWPGVIGMFFAPLVYMQARVLNAGFEPSGTVGFRKYPGTSMAWFLFLGAFGVPALFFAAWAFWDMDVRLDTGQISL